MGCVSEVWVCGSLCAETARERGLGRTGQPVNCGHGVGRSVLANGRTEQGEREAERSRARQRKVASARDGRCHSPHSFVQLHPITAVSPETRSTTARKRSRMADPMTSRHRQLAISGAIDQRHWRASWKSGCWLQITMSGGIDVETSDKCLWQPWPFRSDTSHAANVQQPSSNTRGNTAHHSLFVDL